ncbi:MAG: hypothetical protein JXQ89_10205 [Pelagimonas sp.]
MAYSDVTSAPSALARLMSQLTSLIETPFDRRQRRIAQRIATLRAMTDDQLARRGVRRDDIIKYVFRSR